MTMPHPAKTDLAACLAGLILAGHRPKSLTQQGGIFVAVFDATDEGPDCRHSLRARPNPRPPQDIPGTAAGPQGSCQCPPIPYPITREAQKP